MTKCYIADSPSQWPTPRSGSTGVPLGVGGTAGRIGMVGNVTWEIGGDKKN